METIVTPDFLSGTEKSGNMRNVTPEEARKAYKREWRRKNADKVRKANERFYQRLADKMNAKGEGHENELP